MAEEAKWYVVHTYSGYENKVKADIEKTIENRNLQDQILEVLIPLQRLLHFPLEIMLSLQREYGRILTVLFRKFTRQNRWQLLSLICLAVILRLRLTSQN